MLRLLLASTLFCSGCHVLYPHQEIQVESPSKAEAEASVPVEAEDHLAAAAAAVDAGNLEAAIPHMRAHVDSHPDEIMIRAYLGELLVRTGQSAAAKIQFETFVESAQESEGPAHKHLVHCHTRLMELAQLRDDAFGERLHRGIGLYLLAKQQMTFEDAESEMGQKLLFKAIRELEEAAASRKQDARCSLYLFECWTMLEQPRAAEKALAQAEANAAFSTLTTCERRDLRLALRRQSAR